MTYIRGQERMVAKTVEDYLTTILTDLGWIGGSGWPFGATSTVVVVDDLPQLEGAIAPNTVSITQGHIGDDEEGELGASGGGLWLTSYTVLVDVFGESIGVAKAISSDIRAALTGRIGGASIASNRYIVLKDWSQTPEVDTTSLIYFQDVEMDRIYHASQKTWMAVRATAQLQWNGTEWSL